jgi:ribose 5-phosphate isomerase B
MKIYLGADHAGFELKEKLRSYLTDLGHDVEDKGAFSFVSGDDYPDFVMPVAESVSSDKESLGIVRARVLRWFDWVENRAPDLLQGYK